MRFHAQRSAAFPTLDCERRLWSRGVTHVAGIDEAGRGPLAGPVVAAAVVFPPTVAIEGINDSKKLPPAARETLYAIIRRDALAVGVGVVGPDVVDEINILNATFRAMRLAVENLPSPPMHLLIDGNRFCASAIPATTIVGGDARCYSIAAASIVAKVTRDRLMREFDVHYPGYGFAQHKGYGTRAHYAALRTLGLSPIHRTTFVHLPPGTEKSA